MLPNRSADRDARVEKLKRLGSMPLGALAVRDDRAAG
jgi:hypothetical protein